MDPAVILSYYPAPFFNGELLPELVSEVLVWCTNGALARLARVNKAWYARAQPILEARFALGLSLKWQHDPSVTRLRRTDVWDRSLVPSLMVLQGRYSTLTMSPICMVGRGPDRSDAPIDNFFFHGLVTHWAPTVGFSGDVTVVACDFGSFISDPIYSHLVKQEEDVLSHEFRCLLSRDAPDILVGCCFASDLCDLMSERVLGKSFYYKGAYPSFVHHDWLPKIDLPGESCPALHAYKSKTYDGVVFGYLHRTIFSSRRRAVFIDNPRKFYEEAQRMIYLAQREWNTIYTKIRAYCAEHGIELDGDPRFKEPPEND